MTVAQTVEYVKLHLAMVAERMEFEFSKTGKENAMAGN